MDKIQRKNEIYIKSPLNYVGGKYKLLSQILPLFPKDMDVFVDLFCGGCNVGINCESERYIFNDLLTPIIKMYGEFVKLGIEATVKHIKSRIEEFGLSLTNVEGYNRLRDLYNSSSQTNQLDLFVLVAYSFNHQIRFNKKGGFNMPFGKDRSHFNPTMEKNLNGFINRLCSISDRLEFTNKNFVDIDFETLNLTENSFIYVDPPYLISTATYNEKDGWSVEYEKLLLEYLDKCNSNRIKFGLSNVIEHKGKENTILKEWVEKSNYTIHYLDMDYSNSNYQRHSSETSKSKSVEVFITNY